MFQVQSGVKCRHCGLEYECEAAMAGHRTYCGRKKNGDLHRNCSLCGKKISRGYVKEHENKTCPMRRK